LSRQDVPPPINPAGSGQVPNEVYFDYKPPL
jgi:hypothetical protein